VSNCGSECGVDGATGIRVIGNTIGGVGRSGEAIAFERGGGDVQGDIGPDPQYWSNGGIRTNTLLAGQSACVDSEVRSVSGGTFGDCPD